MILARILWEVDWQAPEPSYVIKIPYADDPTQWVGITLPLNGGPFLSKADAQAAALRQLNGLSDADLTAAMRTSTRAFARDN